jgi:hypothetical protein
MSALVAHTAMSTQALGSETVRDGLKNVLLGPARLYETLREHGRADREAPQDHRADVMLSLPPPAIAIRRSGGLGKGWRRWSVLYRGRGRAEYIRNASPPSTSGGMRRGNSA